jgi:hypothetical protein
VDEGGVDDTIRQGGTAPQAFEVLNVAAMHLGTGLAQRFGGCK